MIDLVITGFIGILIGTITGMVPGIPANTAEAILFASSTFLLTILFPEFLCVLMVAMSIAHAHIKFVPSMLLDIPQERSYIQVIRWPIVKVWQMSSEGYEITFLFEPSGVSFIYEIVDVNVDEISI